MPITHDGKLIISIGKSRKELNWKNKEITWSALVNKLTDTHRTAELYKSYMTASRDRQDEIKDIGGFVGGHIVGGNRNKTSVLNRTLVTLDIDFCDGNIWDDFIMMYGNAAAIYSTHKHSQATPRFRLVMPLSRPVMRDEYEAISRKIAGTLGIDNFDSTTFQPSRLMYWPSTSKDGEYYFNFQDGAWIDADAILASYVDWRDSTEWPACKKEFEAVKNKASQQEDPRSKSGLIGAFCRTYDIHEVIRNFLEDYYDPCSDEHRYTYKHGSTAAGLVVYGDVFAFSHHGTDPTSGTLCNAFDLVRIHLFGLRDKEAAPATKTIALPSYKAMLEWVAKDAPTRRTAATEKYEEAKQDFSTFASETDTVEIEETEVQDMKWLEKLEVNKNGEPKQSIYNVALILENDIGLNKCFAYDEFTNRKVLLHKLPWRRVGADNMYLKDEDEAALRLYIERAYKITSRAAIKDGLDTHIYKRGFHPVRDYLTSLKWDGVKRIDQLAIKYLGAEDTPYTRAVTRKTLVAAVARIFEPGIKFDYVLTLSGVEGKGKSTFIKKLGGAWYSDSFTTVTGKEAYEQIQGCWILEMGEMGAMKKAEIYSIKHFLSKQEDRYRPPYGHNTIYAKRQCVFIASTNEVDFLRGVDGNRRFWVVDTGSNPPLMNIFDPASLGEAERALVWAEAVQLYKDGEPIHLDDVLESQARQIQKDHSEVDDRIGIIIEFLNMKLPDNWETLNFNERRAYLADDEDLREPGKHLRSKVCAIEIWVEALGLHLKDMNQHNTKFIHDILRTMPGWEPAKSDKLRFGKYGLHKAYTRITKLYDNVGRPVKS